MQNSKYQLNINFSPFNIPPFTQNLRNKRATEKTKGKTGEAKVGDELEAVC